jgi:hypothetical protein
MVLKNVKTSLTCEVSNVKSRHRLLVLSCLYGLGLQDRDHLVGILFFSDGVGGCYRKSPTYRMQNQKMIPGLTNQLLVVFEGDYQGQ